MAERTLYLFDGHNILHAGDVPDERALVDRLASFVSLRGARGIVVFDGAGESATVGALEVRFARPADRALERLAVEHRDKGEVYVVSSDQTLRRTAGYEVRHLSAVELLRDLDADADEWRRY